jgi:hypothetical protein
MNTIHRLSMFDNNFLRKILGSKKKEVKENGESYKLNNFITCIFIKCRKADQLKKN